MKESQTKLDVLTKDQAASVDRIKLFLRSEKRGFEDALVYFYLTGIELKLLQDGSTHGNADSENSFKTLCESNFPDLPKKSIYQRMAMAETVKSFPGNFSKKALQIEDGQIPDEIKKPILKEIHEHSDGKSITAVLRDLDIIRQPKVPGHYERKPRDMKKAIMEAGEVDDEACVRWCSDTQVLLNDAVDFIGTQKTATLQRMENIRLQLGHRIQKILKSRGAKTKGL